MGYTTPEILEKDFQTRWEAFHKSCGEQGGRAWEKPEFFEKLKWVFSLSGFVAESCARHPDMFSGLVSAGDLERSYEKGKYDRKLEELLSAVSGEAELSRKLRQFRCREMVRIAWRDLSGDAELSETMEDLTALAEAVLEKSLSFIYDRHCEQYGTPFSRDGKRQRLVVMGMGKLGARELNFSSDIDLIFAFAEPGETQGIERSKTNDQFFASLCRKYLNVLGQTTADGPLFRVDVRLRPYGDNGPLAMNFEATETYYESQGREWERYAWIKGRCVAGDFGEGKRLLAALKPFIYRRYLDYGAFESLRDMKRMIAMEIRKKGVKDNIKLGRGGIREIEFFGQAFQLIRGGVLPDLQEQRIQKVLPILADEGIIASTTCDELLQCYEFLRNTEHRLQEFHDLQTHQIPTDPLERLRLAVSMGFESDGEFSRRLQYILDKVHGHFAGLLEPEPVAPGEREESPTDRKKLLEDLESVWLDPTGEEQAGELLAETGLGDPEQAFRLLVDFRSDSQTQALSRSGRLRVAKLIPRLIMAVGKSDYPELALGRVLEMIKAVQRRSCYIALLLENPDALTHLIRLAVASPWVISFISRHPPLLDELLDPRTLYEPPSREELEMEIRLRMSRFDPDDLELQIEILCLFQQVNSLRVAAADVTGALPLMRVSDHLSYIAETVLDAVLDLSWGHLVEKHGQPDCAFGDACGDRGFAVVAYGKLGGLELGYASDLDLVFLHHGTKEYTQGGKRPIDTPQFFARLGQRVLHILTAHTPAGFLYETDMRLRPSGTSGMLVCHIDGYADYQKNEAWTWEHQALVRARAVAGDRELMEKFEKVRLEILCQKRDPDKLREEVRTMREKMRSQLLDPKDDRFDLKQGAGGMVDIEFIVQYLALLHASEHPEIVRRSDNVRILNALNSTGVIDDQTAHILRDGYLTYRAMAHKLSLQNKSAKVEWKRFGKLREVIANIWWRFLETEA